MCYFHRKPWGNSIQVDFRRFFRSVGSTTNQHTLSVGDEMFLKPLIPCIKKWQELPGRGDLEAMELQLESETLW